MLSTRHAASDRVPLSDGVRLALRFLVAVFFLSPFLVFGSATNSWPVFRPASSSGDTGTNTISNADMEAPAVSQPLAAWLPFSSGYSAGTNTAHAGARSLQCVSSNATDIHGAYQTIVLNQTTPRALKLSGWSKAQNVIGTSNPDYSVYLDIIYTDGTPLWGQNIPFAVGTHDWQYLETTILPAKPIRQLNCYLLFRNTHTGTVWFDDITVSEFKDPVIQFDGAAVISALPTPPPFNPAVQFTLLSGDGLQLQMTQDGGVIEGVTDGTNTLQAADADFASGWFVCDRSATSAWWNVGGWVTVTNGILQQHGVITGLNLSADASYSVTNSAFRIQATVSNLIASDRAISLYFALPVALDGGLWWNSLRECVSVTQAVESATFSSAALGARNLVSQYPLATLATSGGALTLAVPPGQYRPFRLACNRVTRQFFIVFDVGLSSIPTNFPQIATVEVWLYRSDPAWGLRSGLAGLYSRFPSAFARTSTNQGIWVAFADIRAITNISDFGIAYHEIGYNSAFLQFDDTNSIQSFRYVSEPWSYWMNMPTNVPNTNYTPVYDCLLSLHTQGVNAATATLSSGVRDSNGLLQFFPAAAPWCPYGAAFHVNASPFISDPQYSLTKFDNEWNSTIRDVYNHPANGVLDGEYIDSFCAEATIADYSSNHMRTTSFPLTYTTDNPVLMTPLILGTYEMARAISADVHALGKQMMANTLYTTWPGLPIGMGLFDFTGTEINWFNAAGNFVPATDSSLLYARALSGNRPYGFLLNTDFTKVSNAAMENYMRLCSIYAIFPSAFSADASSANYFEQPALYERDRRLFKKYVPIIRALSLAGWQPVTYATADTTNVALEAYGTNSFTAARYLTVRNLTSNTVTANVAFRLAQWAGPNAQGLYLTNLFDGGTLAINVAAGSNSVPLTLPAGESRTYAVRANSPPGIFINDGAFGFHSNEFGFDLTALPGQNVVIEAATNLVDWVSLQTNLIPGSGLIFFGDPGSSTLPHRFYRGRVQ